MDSLLSGSIAGIVADVATHPLGTVKTRLQVQGASASSLTRYGGVAQGLTRILTKEGVGALYKGVGVVVATAAPAQGLFFLGNDKAREALRPHLPAAAASFAAGCVAQLCGSLCWVPMDTVKERLQVEGQLKRGSKAELGGSWNAVRTILRREGLRDSIPRIGSTRRRGPRLTASSSPSTRRARSTPTACVVAWSPASRRAF